MTTTENMTQAMPALDGRIVSILRYWDGLREGRVAPGRIEISPSAITQHLSRICILERPRAGTVRVRLAGATVSMRAGMELRGMPFRSLFELNDRNRAMDAAETAIITPSVNILSLSRPERTGPVPEAMMAILPLTDTRGALTRALAIYSERPSVTPYVRDMRGRFHITESWTLDIPESGPIVGPMGNTSAITPVATRVMGPKLASVQASRAQAHETQAPNAQALDAQALDGQARPVPQQSRPVFEVIDGGRA